LAIALTKPPFEAVVVGPSSEIEAAAAAGVIGSSGECGLVVCTFFGHVPLKNAPLRVLRRLDLVPEVWTMADANSENPEWKLIIAQR
jgi:hypothetical protein